MRSNEGEYHNRLGLAFLRFASQRLSNYGYGWRDFRRLSNHATRARAALYRTHPAIIGARIHEEFSHGDRLTYNMQTEEFDYCVGQSFNEEFINLIRGVARYGRDCWVS